MRLTRSFRRAAVALLLACAAMSAVSGTAPSTASAASKNCLADVTDPYVYQARLINRVVPFARADVAWQSGCTEAARAELWVYDGGWRVRATADTRNRNDRAYTDGFRRMSLAFGCSASSPYRVAMFVRFFNVDASGSFWYHTDSRTSWLYCR
jgi:hypothetical protein